MPEWTSQTPKPQRGGTPDYGASTERGASEGVVGDREIGRLRDEAHHLADEARHTAEDMADEAREGAADNAARAGKALHKAADDLGEGDVMGSLLHAAASQMDRAARSLRRTGSGDMVRDLAAFARHNPALFIGGAVAAGFALSRLGVAGGMPRQVEQYAGQRKDARRVQPPGAQDPVPAYGADVPPPTDGRSAVPGATATPSGLPHDVRAGNARSPTGPGDRLSGSGSGPTTTTPGRQPPGARPQSKDDTDSLRPDE